MGQKAFPVGRAAQVEKATRYLKRTMSTEGPGILALISCKFSKHYSHNSFFFFIKNMSSLMPCSAFSWLSFLHTIKANSHLPPPPFFKELVRMLGKSIFPLLPCDHSISLSAHKPVATLPHTHTTRRMGIIEGSDGDREIYVLSCARHCPSALHIVTHLNFSNLRFKWYFNLYFMDEETESPTC